MGPEREQHPGGDGQLAHRYCPSADEDLPSPSSLGSPLPGGTNCYVPTAVTIAIWQQPGCCTGTGAGGEEMVVPLWKRNVGKDKGLNLLWPVVFS